MPGVAGIFIRGTEVLQLLVERFQGSIGQAAAHGHAVADEELEEVVEEAGNLAGEGLELFLTDVSTGIGHLLELALNEVVDELRAVHFPAVLVYLFDDILFDYHDKIVFVE